MLLDSRKQLASPIEEVIARAGEVILGKEGQIRLAMACILARGHLLIEDVPGVGKTTLSHALARLLGLDYQRIQFTSDILPADVIGVSIFDRESSTFRFHPGPIFAQIILADEINRASPKAQSALLEAMEEHQVTAEGETRRLPEPFFVIATQNPLHQVGTFPLPESQLDRFLMRIHLGYPDAKAERALLMGEERRDMIQHLQPAMTAVQLLELQAAVPQVQVSEALLDYAQALISHTRHSPRYAQGLSPRAGLALLRAAQAWAMMKGRRQVLPEDVQAILPSVVGHRLHGSAEAAKGGFDAARDLLTGVAIPDRVMFANIRQSIADWIFRAAVPEAPPVTLVQRRIFILPTRQGYFFGFTLLLLLLASINYTLSLGFLLTFLLAAMGGVAMLHTWRNLAHLKLRPGHCPPVFAGETAHFGVTVETPSRTRFAVAMRQRDSEATFVDVERGNVALMSLPAAATRRGRVACGRLEIFTRYPVGLFHAWSYFDFGLQVIVYPRPDSTAGAPPTQSRGEAEEGIPIPGDDEFNLLRPYHAGDPPRQIAWKALARGQGLLTKEFNATASSELWFDWNDARAVDPEARLSVLCHWVIEAERLGQSYGLRLPGTSIAPGRGEAHRTQCLNALALHGDPKPQ